MSYSYENVFGKRSDQQSIKDVLGGSLGNRSNAVNQYKKSKHKWRKELKYFKEQNKGLYSIAKNYGSFSELKISRRSSLRLPISVVILVATIQKMGRILIYPYP